MKSLNFVRKKIPALGGFDVVIKVLVDLSFICLVSSCVFVIKLSLTASEPIRP